MAGTTINGLNAVTSLTAQDEVPVWDKEASGEPTKKITAQNMTASVKTLGSLVNTTEMNNALAGKQNTLTFDTTPTTGSTNPVTSGGIATAISQSTAKLDKLQFTTSVSGGTVIQKLELVNGSGGAGESEIRLYVTGAGYYVLNMSTAGLKYGYDDGAGHRNYYKQLS